MPYVGLWGEGFPIPDALGIETIFSFFYASGSSLFELALVHAVHIYTIPHYTPTCTYMYSTRVIDIVYVAKR